MIRRFREITKGLYRGSAPTPQDVLKLKKDFGIKKIVSLDKDAGDKISRTCKILGIKQDKVYLDGSRPSLINLLHHNLKRLLLDNGPTFLHCHEGKDRTGLVSALFKCKYMGMDPAKSIEEAKSLGFGIGVDPKIVKLFEKLIMNVKQEKDINSADIVANERQYIGDNRDSFLDEGHQGSFAPYLSETRQYPMDKVYNETNDQSPTRENYEDYKTVKENKENNLENIPLVGIYNNDAGGRGAGVTENMGGFIYD